MMMKNKKNVPDIRFKGFSEEWTEQLLGDCADIIGGGTPSTSNREYWDGDIDWYSPAEIGEKVFVDGSKRKITELGLKESSAKILPIGTVLFSSRAGIGSTAILAKEGSTNQGFQSVIPQNDKLDTYFIFSRTRELKKYGETNGAGSTFIEVSGKQMECMPIINPTIDEQKAIGSYFQNVDRLINASQTKLDKLKNIKKACLEKMFPKNDSTTPELRFKGFTDGWLPETLGELSEPLEYGLNAPATTYDGVNKYIRITDIDDDMHILNCNGLTSPNINLSLSARYQLKVGDVLFARTGASVGKSYHYKGTDGLVYYAGFLIRARIKSNVNSEFVFQNTLTNKYDKFVKITSQRSGQPGINAQEYSSWRLSLPKSLDEQRAIGCFFKNIDDLIIKTEQQINKLKNIKRACLDKMFVNE
ncbi:MAG: restriction endonuclease subunit S [Oscillospiraceae bacterium]